MDEDDELLAFLYAQKPAEQKPKVEPLPSTGLEAVVVASSSSAPAKRAKTAEEFYSFTGGASIEFHQCTTTEPLNARLQRLQDEYDNNIVGHAFLTTKSVAPVLPFIDTYTPKQWKEIVAFAQHVTFAVKTPTTYSAMLQKILHAAKEGISTCLVGPAATGKTTILRLLAAHLDYEFVQVLEDSKEDLKEFLQGAKAVGLEQKKRLYVFEHAETLTDFGSINRLRSTGAVFYTMWPSDKDLRKCKDFESIVFPDWDTSSKMMFLERFGPAVPDDFREEALLQGGGCIGTALCLMQIGKTGVADAFPPVNLRVLVENSLTARHSQKNDQLLEDADSDAILMLMQETAPETLARGNAGADSLCHVMGAIAEAQFSTREHHCSAGKELLIPLLAAAARHGCKSLSATRGYSSGISFGVPKCMWDKFKTTPEHTFQMAAEIQATRGRSDFFRKRYKAKNKGVVRKLAVKKTAGLTEEDLLDDCPEMEWRETDFVDHFQEYSLFLACRGKQSSRFKCEEVNMTFDQAELDALVHQASDSVSVSSSSSSFSGGSSVTTA